MKRFGKNLIHAAVPCAAVIALLFGVTACKQFTADINEELGYWAAEAVVDRDIVISPNPSYASGSSIPCVPSSGPVTVTMKVRNPKNFTFIMPNSPGAPTDIVRFGSGVSASEGADYKLESSGQNTLTLTYKPAFLKRYERSRANIGAAITLYSTDGRKFNQNYKFDLEANTPPPDPSITFAKTTGSPSYYVLCIEVPNMPGAVVNGKRLHKDIAHIAINGTEYDLKMNTGNTDFVRPGSSSFITTGAESLDGSGTPMTPGAWVLYYKTSTAIGGPQASYTVTLKDAKGLRSQASATTPTVPITEWEALRTAVQTASDGAVITVGGDITYGLDGTKSTIEVTKSITVKSNVNGTKRTLSAGGTGADGSSANSTVEAVFEVKGSGITLKLEDLTLTKTEKYAVYVHNGASLEMNKVTIEDCKTNFNAAGIYFYKGKNLTVTNSLIKKCKGKGSSSAGGIDIQEPQTDGTLSITGTTFENCKAVGNGTDKGNGGGINIYKGSLTLSGCTLTGCEAKNGGGVHVSNGKVTMTGGSIEGSKVINGNGGGVYVTGDKASFTMDGGKITQCKAAVTSPSSTTGRGGGIYGANTSSSINITIKGTAEISYNESTCQGVGSGGGICGGNNSIITVSENATIQNNKAKGFGGGVYFKGTFKFTGGTIAGNQVTDATSLGTGIFLENSGTILEMSGNARVANDNDIYLPNSRVVTITGALSNNPVARITPENYNASTQVLTGSEVASEHGKFTVTPKSGTPPEYWGISNSGNLTRDNASIFNTISKDQIQAADSSMSNAIISNRKANLEGKLILYKTTDNNYGIMHVTEVDNTSEGGTGHIEFDYKTFNSDGSIKKSENYKKLEGQSLFNLDDESTGYVTEIDFILRNIDNTDAGKHFEPKNSAKFYVLP